MDNSDTNETKRKETDKCGNIRIERVKMTQIKETKKKNNGNDPSIVV